MKKKLRIVIPILVLAAAAAVGYRFFGPDGDSNRIVISGNIDVTQVDASFKIQGRLAERLVDEGEAVRKGQVVARLDPVDQKLQVGRAEAELAQTRSVLAELEAGSREEEIDRAAARVDQARSALEELESGSRRQEIAEAEAALERALASAQARKNELELARSDHRRNASLMQNGGISRQEYDRYRTRMETAVNAYTEASAAVQSARQQLSLVREGPRSERVRMARANLRQAEAEYRLVQAGPRRETIDGARARVAEAEQALKQAQQALADTELVAPFDGVVLSKSAEPGAYLYPGTPVVTLAELDRVWLRAWVSETDLGRIRRNQKALVFTDTYPDKSYPGRLVFISSQAEFTPKSVQTHEERVHLVYRVKIDLDNPNGELKPGMPADAELQVSP
ncbi:MAG: HlyD family efflux transporter periplasmic adaptor subunit [Desulfobacteraceae bacterium]|nr:HlyD family efflux transporter periplasmic adaptor subunit [Desulfobacteraceae bacterium]